MEEELRKIVASLSEELKACNKEADILNVKSKYVGKKSRIMEILSGLKDMSVDEKRKYGSLINNTKKEMEGMVTKAIE